MEQNQALQQTFPYKRYLGLDFGKGFGIFSMLMIHAIIQQVAQFDGSLFVPTFSTIPIPLLILLAPVLFLALWGPGFVFFIVIGITIQMNRINPSDQKKRRKYLLGRVIGGIMMLIIKRLILLLRLIISNLPHFSLTLASFFSVGADAIDAIAWASMICPLLYSMYLRINKSGKPIYGIVVFTILAYGWMLLSPVLIQLGMNFIELFDSKGLHFISLFIHKIISGRFKLVQTLSFGFVGISFGLILSSSNDVKKKLLRLMWLMIGCSTILAVILILLDTSVLNHFVDEDVPLPLQMFNLGYFLTLCILFLIRFDFCNPVTRQKRAKRGVWITRYSIISFTAFTLDSAITRIPYLFMTQFFGSSVDRTGEIPQLAWNFWQIVIYMIVVWLFWELLIRLWEKLKFIVSVDWLMVAILSKLRKRGKPHLPILQILYDPIFETPILREEKICIPQISDESD